MYTYLSCIGTVIVMISMYILFIQSMKGYGSLHSYIYIMNGLLWLLIIIIIILVVLLIYWFQTSGRKYFNRTARILDPLISKESSEHHEIYNAYLEYTKKTGHGPVNAVITRDSIRGLPSYMSEYPTPNTPEYPTPNVDVQTRDMLMNKRPKIAIVSVSIGNRAFSKYSRQRLEEYCNLHSYDLIYVTETLDNSLPPIWQKIPAVRNTLLYGSPYETVNARSEYIIDTGLVSSQEIRSANRPVYNSLQEHANRPMYDAVMWIDDDIYITNMSISIEKVLEVTDCDIVFTADRMCYEPTLVINSGMFIIRNTKVGREYMYDLLNGRKLFNGRYLRGYFHEQSVATYLFYTKYHPYITILQAGVLQSFFSHPGTIEQGIWKPGDFALHLCGDSTEKRMDEFIRLYEQGLPLTSIFTEILKDKR